MAPAVQTEALEQIVLRRKGVGTPISRAIAVSIQHVTSREGRDKTDFFPSTLLGMVYPRPLSLRRGNSVCVQEIRNPLFSVPPVVEHASHTPVEVSVKQAKLRGNGLESYCCVRASFSGDSAA